MQANEPPEFNVEEGLALLRAIFPHYPDLHGMQSIPNLQTFLRTYREKQFQAA